MLSMVSRRNLIRSGGMAASVLLVGASAAGRAHSAPAPTLDAFMAASQRVTGKNSLDRDMGKSILEAFVASGRVNEIALLVADADPEFSQLAIANAVVAAWYSGLSPLAGAPDVTGFNEALVWDALTYTKPWGSCGGDVGYWGAPPDGEP